MQLSRLFNQPEYIHTVLNHFPLIGLAVAMMAVGLALVARNRVALWIGLGLVGLVSLSAWPVYHYGEEGYDRVLSMSDDAGQAYLKEHQELAERWTFTYFITAGVAALGCALAWKWPQSLKFSALLALVLAAASLVAGLAIAHAGGQIRHREFRTGTPPASEEHR